MEESRSKVRKVRQGKVRYRIRFFLMQVGRRLAKEYDALRHFVLIPSYTVSVAEAIAFPCFDEAKQW